MTLPTFNVPPVGPRQGKVWGVTQLVFAHNGTEAHQITAKAGGYSSRHQHLTKWNRFVCVSGKLLIRQWRGITGDFDETYLTAGQITDVPPGVWHQFEALEDSVAFEFYWVVLDAGDIDRGSSEGGVREAAAVRAADPEWSTCEVRDNGGVLVGYQVYWNEQIGGRWLLVGHYNSAENGGEPTLRWCEHAAERHAARLNEMKKGPWEYPDYHRLCTESKAPAAAPT